MPLLATLPRIWRETHPDFQRHKIVSLQAELLLVLVRRTTCGGRRLTCAGKPLTNSSIPLRIFQADCGREGSAGESAGDTARRKLEALLNNHVC